MELDFAGELTEVADLRHRVRRLRWFKASFRREAEHVARQHHVALTIDERRLTEAFLAWMEAFKAQKPYAMLDRRDFTLFAAGLLLREFIRARPVTLGECEQPPHRRAESGEAPPLETRACSIVRFWPEGFLYTHYCLSVLSAVVQQEFGEPLDLAEGTSDLRLWWSYRENVREDPALAIAFLDRFVGGEPNWQLPDAAESRAAMRRATQRLFAGRPLLSS